MCFSYDLLTYWSWFVCRFTLRHCDQRKMLGLIYANFDILTIKLPNSIVFSISFLSNISPRRYLDKIMSTRSEDVTNCGIQDVSLTTFSSMTHDYSFKAYLCMYSVVFIVHKFFICYSLKLKVVSAKQHFGTSFVLACISQWRVLLQKWFRVFSVIFSISLSFPQAAND